MRNIYPWLICLSGGPILWAMDEGKKWCNSIGNWKDRDREREEQENKWTSLMMSASVKLAFTRILVVPFALSLVFLQPDLLTDPPWASFLHFTLGFYLSMQWLACHYFFICVCSLSLSLSLSLSPHSSFHERMHLQRSKWLVAASYDNKKKKSVFSSSKLVVFTGPSHKLNIICVCLWWEMGEEKWKLTAAPY